MSNKPTASPVGHEIIIGLVAGVGTDLNSVVNALTKQFNRTIRYTTHEIHVSTLLNYMSEEYKPSTVRRPALRVEDRIEKCNKFRTKLELDDAMGILSVAEIRKQRNSLKDINAVYIVNQIKNASEVKLFRKIYGKNFILLSVYESRDKRISRLISWPRTKSKEKIIDDLIKKDEKEEIPYGQRMRDAFVEADYFIDANQLEIQIKRLSEILLGYPYHTPSKDEINMMHAWSSSVCSADLSRQVGAAIANKDGDTVSIGCNEVPKYAGGHYWEGDNPDNRDFTKDGDANQISKNKLIKETISIISSDINPEEKYKELQDAHAEILDIIEFCRAVHAEDAAICDAARRGICIQGTTLYCTTFPCHLCTKHIIAVGIETVIYIYPYPKSRANDLYKDIIDINPKVHGNNQKVVFKHFMGVAPRKILKIFTSPENRKDKSGNKIEWTSFDKVSPFLSTRTPLAYYDKETAYLKKDTHKILPLIECEPFKTIFTNVQEEYENLNSEKKYWAENEVK